MTLLQNTNAKIQYEIRFILLTTYFSHPKVRRGWHRHNPWVLKCSMSIWGNGDWSFKTESKRQHNIGNEGIIRAVPYSLKHIPIPFQVIAFWSLYSAVIVLGNCIHNVLFLCSSKWNDMTWQQVCPAYHPLNSLYRERQKQKAENEFVTKRLHLELKWTH